MSYGSKGEGQMSLFAQLADASRFLYKQCMALLAILCFLPAYATPNAYVTNFTGGTAGTLTIVDLSTSPPAAVSSTHLPGFDGPTPIAINEGFAYIINYVTSDLTIGNIAQSPPTQVSNTNLISL